MEKHTELAGKLKSGEYDGSDIMAAWIALEESENNHARLVEALREVTATLAWVAHGECRAIHSGPVMPSNEAQEMASTLLAQLDGEPE